MTALVAVAAVISSGYSAQRLDLNDSSVWVANGLSQYIGRANTEVFELNTIVESSSNDIDVVQSGSTVLLVDHTDAKLDIVDPATSEVTDSVALPPNQARVFLAGSNIVIYSQATGELWILALAALSSFDSTQLPSLNLGADSVVSVDSNGLLFGFSPDAGQVYRVDAASAAVVQQTENTHFDSGDDSFEVTSVGGQWAVLDTDTGVLETASGITDLGDSVEGTPVLQQPAAEGDAVLVAHAGGLVSVRSGAGVTDLVTGRSGIAAAPTVSGGCQFAGWSDGSAWRHCADDPASGSTLDLSGMPGAPQLAFQSNGDRVLLNDTRAGASWAVQADGELIDNWDDLISVLDDEQQVEQNDETTPPETEQAQLPPVAVDDAFGARPGRASPINVLLNDYDPNGDVLVVSQVDSLDPAVGRVDIIHASQAVQLTPAAGASGTITFGYTISDGRGGTASATVTVTVRTEAENSPPVQVRQTRADVGSGGQVSLEVLGDWVDPDGDPFYLSDAAVAAPDTVAHKADGTVVFSDNGAGGAEKSVSLTVTDGAAEGFGTLVVAVSPTGEVPILCDAFVVLAYSGVEVRVAPLEHVRGGNGAARLNAVPPKSGVTIKANFERGTFRVTSETVGTHYLDYVVTDDVQTANCVVRVDVAAPPDSNTTPITVPKTVFIVTLSSQTIDVASTDIDPGGGVLLVTGVMNNPTTSGVQAEVLDQRAVRITLRKLLSGPVTFNYRISNGLAEAGGTITVIEIPPPDQLQPPIARDDTATVRVGDAITIPVMDNDEHPDGETITLDPQLVSNVSDDSGLLFTSGNTLRYLAPDHPGNFTATYRILGPLGEQTAEAQVTIQVREPNADTNHAPAPGRITARVLAGEQVRIDVPLDGIDPDGDSVQLLGQETSPEKGTVVEVGSNYILYEAGDYSAGTDTFTYTLIDALGARATGTIRVGISPRLDGARNPVATEDEVRVRTGSSVSVQVLANDSDPDGGSLTVTAVEPNDDETVASITDGSIVTVTPPSVEGIYGVLYSIANERGGTAEAFIRVIVLDEAPLAYPLASDSVLTLSDILDRDTVDVSVLDRVFFADGAASDLNVAVLPGYPDAEVLPNKQIRVTIGDERQIIPFAVSHPEDPNVRSFAFIWVPGFNDALPQLDRRAGRLVVTSEETLTFDINDYVIAVGGKQVRLTDSSTVAATHSDGSSLVVDRDTLQFTSADLYFGTASISFEVTDGTSATDPDGRKAILVLPITVEARENQAPSFNGAVIDFEPGQQKVIDLVELTNYPYDDDLDELAYSVIDAAPVGFDYSLNGQVLTITANDDAVKYATTSITLGVRDAVKEGQAGRIELTVVPSTRPLARPAADNATTKRGAQTVIDVLLNDEATNPFPGQPLTVVQVTGANGASLPAGVTVNVSADNSRITVDVAPTAAPLDINLQYQVADATNDPDRYAWGTVRISIQDVPDAPAKPLRQDNSFVNGELTLRFTPTQPNNSPVTNYRVTSSSHGNYSHDCGTSVICSLPGLTVGALYTFQVVATNAIGDSAPSPLSDAFSIDYLPSAPATVTAVANTSVAAGGAIDVSWSAVSDPSPGTPVVGYTIVVVGVTATTAPASATSATITGLANDVVYTVLVYARNSAQVTAESDWNRTGTTVHTVGPPPPPSPAPQATSATNGDIEVTWGASASNGGGSVSYDIARVTGTATPADCSAEPALATNVTSPYTDTTAVDGETYSYFVYASNGSYCTASGTGATISLEAPGATTGGASVENRGTGQFDILAGALSASGTVVKYQYLLSSDGTWRDLPGDNWATALGAPGTTYGQPIDVSFRACRNDSDSYCGPASATTTLTPVNARVTGASCAASSGTAPVIDQPANVGGVSASYQVAYNQPILFLDSWSSFGSADDPVPGDATEMRVKATVNGYTDPGYGQFTCTP